MQPKKKKKSKKKKKQRTAEDKNYLIEFVYMANSDASIENKLLIATKGTHPRNNDDISDKEVEILNNIYKRMSKTNSIENLSSVDAYNSGPSEDIDTMGDHRDDWTVSQHIEKEKLTNSSIIAQHKTKLKKTRNKKACDVCKKKKIKCIYNFDDDRTEGNHGNYSEDTVIPSNKQYLGIVCAYCKRNNTKCTFLAPERKRGYKSLLEDEGKQTKKLKQSTRSKETHVPKQKIKDEDNNEKSIGHNEVNTSKKKVSRLSNPEKLKKYESLFDAMFNANTKEDQKLKIDSFDPKLFMKIYDSINYHDTSLNNYEFDGSRNNMLNSNHFQIAIDRYEYFLKNKLTNEYKQSDNFQIKFFSLQVPLPTKERAIELIENAWLESFVVFRFYPVSYTHLTLPTN